MTAVNVTLIGIFAMLVAIAIITERRDRHLRAERARRQAHIRQEEHRAERQIQQITHDAFDRLLREARPLNPGNRSWHD